MTRVPVMLALGPLGAAVLLTVMWKPSPLLAWNVSNSAPGGLYAIDPLSSFAAGDMVLSRMPVAWREVASSRRYLPGNVPLLKRVAAASGDTVCAQGHRIWINGRMVAARLAKDGQGRTMPAWSGCRTLSDSEVFLLMAESVASFDGRYFGPTARSDVIGRAKLLWAH